METTVGRLLLEDAVPPDLRGSVGTLDKAGLRTLHQALATGHAGKYREVAKRLHDVGAAVAFKSGGYSPGLDDLIAPPEVEKIRDLLRGRVDEVLADRSLTREKRNAKLIELSKSFRPMLVDAIKAHTPTNAFHLQVKSNAKGNWDNVLALLAGELGYADQNFKPIPVPAIRGFGEGIDPHEYAAAAFGARQGLVTLKLCLERQILVRMADGSTKQISELQPGDRVVGVSRDGVTSPTTVTAVYNNGFQPCRKYVFRDQASRTGRIELTATPDHQVLARLMYGKPGSANAHMSVYRPTPFPLTRVSKVFRAAATSGGDWDGVVETRAGVLGVMLGDGYLGRDVQNASRVPQLSCGDPELLTDMRPKFAAMGLHLRKMAGYSYSVSVPRTSCVPNDMIYWLKKLGLFGKRSQDKFIPDVVWTWDNASVAALIGGLLASDGYVRSAHGKNRRAAVVFTSTSRQMVTSLRELLAVRFGVHCPPPIRIPVERIPCGNYDQWRIDITYAESLRNLVKYVPIPGVKGRRLRNLVASIVTTEKTRTPGYTPILDECADVGLREVYDITVDHPDHLFLLANGLIVHNCLDADTPVMMADWSARPLKTVEPGEWVMGADRSGKAMPVRVVALHDNGPRECVSVVFRRKKEGDRSKRGKGLMEPRGGANTQVGFVSTTDHQVLVHRQNGGSALFRIAALTHNVERPFLATGCDGRPGANVRDPAGVGALWAHGWGDSAVDPLPDWFALWSPADATEFMATFLTIVGQWHPGQSYRLTHRDRRYPDAVARVLSVRCGIRPVPVVYEEGMYRLSIRSKDALAKMAALLGREPIPPLGHDHYRFASRKRAGTRDTMDLEVDHPDHLFVLANGLIVSNSTAKGGYFSKRLSGAAHNLVVTDKDGPTPAAGSAPRGLPVPVDDPDNEGALLAHPVGDLARNTVLTPRILADLRSKGVKEILVRSPTVGGPPDGGVYANDVGVRERGMVSPIGEFVGISAANAISEPSVQALISSKHSGGVAGATGAQEGFPVLDRLVSIPETYPGGASHSRVDGVVHSIDPAPQGGWFIRVGDEVHYAGVDRKPMVKPGEAVEAGDELTDGTPNPAEIVAHKGVGEGKRRFVEAFMNASRQAGFKPHRRNLELLARGLIDHVRLEGEHGPYGPGDIVSYTTLEHEYMPRQDAQSHSPRSAVGRYLESPALHYSIGTRVTPRVASKMQEHGVQSVLTHHAPPSFVPEMIRSHEVVNQSPDWMTRVLGTHMEKSILRGAHRAETTDPAGASFVEPVARGVGLGIKGRTAPGLKLPG